MRPYILAECNWKIIQENQYTLAVLPWGATEAHNYHLPYSTDVIEADAIAAGAAKIAFDKGAKLTVLPCIPFGVNTGQHDVTLDINLNPSTQMAILDDVIATLYRQNIYKLVIVNTHGGNDFRQMLRELGLKYPEMFLVEMDWYKMKDISSFFDEPGDHAGEAETSMMLHLRPDLVRPLQEAGDGKAKKFSFTAMQEGWAWSERHWLSVTKDTGVGNPKQATAEKGRLFLEHLYQKAGEFLYQLAVTDKKDYYI